MKKEKIKQIILISVAFFLIFFGYLNYNFFNKSIEVASDNNDINLGDVQLVSSDYVESNENIVNTIGNIVPNDENFNNIAQNINNTFNTENNSKIYSDDNYFEETKIERDRMYSEILETYQKLINTRRCFIRTESYCNARNIKYF